MSTSTSGVLGFARQHVALLVLDGATLAFLLFLTLFFHGKAMAREQMLQDSYALHLQSAGYAIQGGAPARALPATVSAPRTLQTHDDSQTKDGVVSDNGVAPADLTELEASIAWYDTQIAKARAKRRDARWFEEHRDALVKRRAAVLAHRAEPLTGKFESTEGY